jgi:transposase
MKKNIIFIAIDVDDKAFHGCGLNSNTGELREFTSKPIAAHLAKKLESFNKEDFEIKVCYEATYLGFSLWRALKKLGYHCDVIAPSLIPKLAGKVVKTDRLDCRRLVEYYANGQLTAVHVPDSEDETARDLIRARKFLSKQMTALKVFILSTCRRMGLNYKDCEGSKKYYWTTAHRAWLKKQIKERGGVEGINLTMLLNQLDQLNEQIKLYSEKIEGLAESERYREPIMALKCYRGIDTLIAMTLAVELGDISRFKHPKQLCSYSGMELIEYSSGGHDRRYRMSKMGNRHIRTAIIEACQLASSLPHVSKKLKERRKEAKKEYIEIADRCMNRLHKKSQRLLRKNKIANKVKAACAREMLCFVWESLRAAA